MRIHKERKALNGQGRAAQMQMSRSWRFRMHNNEHLIPKSESHIIHPHENRSSIDNSKLVPIENSVKKQQSEAKSPVVIEMRLNIT
jgi:hypothetical protein